MKNALAENFKILETAVRKLHARMSPSKAHRWLVCPGSMHVSGDDPETEWAAEGTRKHAVLALVLTGKTPLAGDVIETEAGDYKVPLEVIEQCEEIREFIEHYKATHPGWAVEVETRVEVGTHVWPNMLPGDCAGTTDAAAYCWDELLVLDAKFGFVQVEARGNPQLMLYALGLLFEVPFPIQWVTLCVAQPGYDGAVIFREHRLSANELLEWAFQQQHIVEEIEAGSRRLQADDHACRYCPARTYCPERLKALDAASDEAWMERPLEELLPVLPRLRAICKDIEQKAMADLNSGKPVRGWKLVASRSRRKWSEEDETKIVAGIEADVGAEAVLVEQQFYDRKLKSPAQMEKAIRRIKKMPVKDAKAIVDKYAFQPSGMPKLAPESDERPALDAGGFTLEDVLRASLEEENGEE